MNRYIRIILGFFFLSPGGIILITDSLPKTFKISRVAFKMDNELKKAQVETTTRMKRTRSTADPDATTDHEDKKLKQEERIKKKKVAMMFAYSGVGYYGLQRNQGMKTIEGEIMDALLKAGLITEQNYNTPQSIQFQRAARTDKGVSALKQIVSLKLPEAANKEDINAHLPEQIRILSIKRVTKGFNSKNSCDARTYSYTCPSYAFATPEQTGEDFRLSPDRLSYVQALLKQYEGTHNFHNFTSKRKPLDPSNSRFIMSFVVEPPFVRNGLEFITLKVKGQSFMLHQIRKMVGVAMAIARNHVTADIIDRAYGLDQFDLPMAPGLGLLLEQVHYDIYDLRYGADGVHESLHFHEADEEVEKFRERFILPYLGRVEASEKPMLEWLQLLSEHSFDTREVKAALAEANGAGVTDGARGEMAEAAGEAEPTAQTAARVNGDTTGTSTSTTNAEVNGDTNRVNGDTTGTSTSTTNAEVNGDTNRVNGDTTGTSTSTTNAEVNGDSNRVNGDTTATSTSTPNAEVNGDTSWVDGDTNRVNGDTTGTSTKTTNAEVNGDTNRVDGDTNRVNGDTTGTSTSTTNAEVNGDTNRVNGDTTRLNGNTDDEGGDDEDEGEKKIKSEEV